MKVWAGLSSSVTSQTVSVLMFLRDSHHTRGHLRKRIAEYVKPSRWLI